MKLFRKEEVAAHNSLHTGIWVIYGDNVYDVTEFALDHPGGVDIIIHYGGGDISKLMGDSSVHDHSPMAYQILEKYKIGKLAKGAAEESLVAPRSGNSQDVLIKKTAVIPDEAFIDLQKPLVKQIFFPAKKMNKDYYLEQVHAPRYLPHPATFFANPMLEVLTRTPWWLIALLWGPCFLYLVALSAQNYPLWKVMVFLGQGLFAWSMIEYGVHRFLFHLDSFVPNHQFFFGLHFLLHGVHHFLPMDRYRLVLPPVLFLPLAYSFWSLFHALFYDAMAKAIFSGTLLGYIVYDLNHYYMHHGVPLTDHLRHMKTYHINHHYLNHELGFGITSKFFDQVFDTLLPDDIAKSQ